MRSLIGLSSLLPLVFAAACGGSTTTPKYDFATALDMTTTTSNPDLSANTDGGGSGDMKAVTPNNTPGSVFCYKSSPCATSGSDPVCCDAPGDGGFTDTCVASVSACTTQSTEANAYQCGQAADCASGQICCGKTGTSSKSGDLFFDGTTCETTCATGETQLCVTATECKSGTTCAGQEISGRDVGLCK